MSLSRKRVRAGAQRRVLVRFTVSERSKVSFGIERRGRKRWSDVKSSARRTAGRGSIAFSSRALKPGRYHVVVRAEDGAHNRSHRGSRRLRVT